MISYSCVGRAVKSQLSDAMKFRIAEYETCCHDLMGKFDRRVGMDTNKKVVRIEEVVDRNCRWCIKAHHRQSIYKYHRCWHATRLQNNQGWPTRYSCWIIIYLSWVDCFLIQPRTFINGYHHLIALGTTMKHERSIKQKPAPGLSQGHSSLSGRHNLVVSCGSMEFVSSLIDFAYFGCVLR